MMSMEFFLTLLIGVSVFTALVTEAIKKIMDEAGKIYKSNILAGAVSVVLSVLAGTAADSDFTGFKGTGGILCPVRKEESAMDVYRVLGEKGRLYLPKAQREAAGIYPGSIVRIHVEKGVLQLSPVSLIEVGDHSPEAVESYLRAASRKLENKTKVSLAGELLRQAETGKEE